MRGRSPDCSIGGRGGPDNWSRMKSIVKMDHAYKLKIVFESAIMSLMNRKFPDSGTRICESQL